MKLFLSLVSLYLLTSCTATPSAHSPINPIQLIDNIQELTDRNKGFVKFPQQDNYSICHDHSCAKFSFIHLSKRQWSSIETLFIPLAEKPEQEREQIKQAVALLETYSGEQAGTDKDLAQNNLSRGIHGQLDCIDEATNTTVYLRLLSNAGLLKMHKQASRTHRGGFLSPHNTATIIGIQSNSRYAVDSWFYANGEQPIIIPLSQWKDGWKPENK